MNNNQSQRVANVLTENNNSFKAITKIYSTEINKNHNSIIDKNGMQNVTVFLDFKIHYLNAKFLHSDNGLKYFIISPNSIDGLDMQYKDCYIAFDFESGLVLDINENLSKINDAISTRCGAKEQLDFFHEKMKKIAQRINLEYPLNN